jgi:hypothetical protein
VRKAHSERQVRGTPTPHGAGPRSRLEDSVSSAVIWWLASKICFLLGIVRGPCTAQQPPLWGQIFPALEIYYISGFIIPRQLYTLILILMVRGRRARERYAQVDPRPLLTYLAHHTCPSDLGLVSASFRAITLSWFPNAENQAHRTPVDPFPFPHMVRRLLCPP